MAYLKDIVHECGEYGCTSRATKQVFNYRNAPMGEYCNRHVQRALKRQQEIEAT